jgi:predicted dehydrogenase
MKTIRWGMIGCGDVTERKSGPGFAKARHSELRAVMRRNGALAADYARRHGVARSHDDASAIIDADDIDAVYIATLTDSHREYTLRCAAAGKPVYVEKPMGMDHGQCLDMIAACRAAGVPLWVGFYRRALPRFLAVRDLVAQGAIGEVRLAVSCLTQRLPDPAAFADGGVPWRVNPALSGGGFFFEGACHTLDFLDFLFGPIVDVRGFSGNQAGTLSRRGHRRRQLPLRVGRLRKRHVVLFDRCGRRVHRARRIDGTPAVLDLGAGADPVCRGDTIEEVPVPTPSTSTSR